MSKFNKFSTLVNSLATSDVTDKETIVASIATEPTVTQPVITADTTEPFNVLPKVQRKVGEVFTIDNKQVKVVEVLESSLEGYTLHVKNINAPFDSFLV